MSVASSPSFPCIKLRTPSSSSSSSSPAALRFTVRSSQADGPLRRPTAPTPVKPSPPSPPAAPTAATVAVQDKNVITLEFQRQKAKELQEYFKQKKLEKTDQGPFFGFIAKNEISNGRWAMFGFAVGMLTEYATGSDFVDQLKILFSNFGILDLD
ncbi:light-harvesting complex-like protein OHP2, chloroplastic [Salvia miltiorrhiza]|uniref:light-harvesting complex-like protein OHP2, chloroplastic n=1 Tax=Salvia miltiorrhiza TaxID=226208 RepID=UPI0025ACE16E|nr:light-harvesting complex-like protein OHP2, chloroplastic [Salvia miltiorrhiza]